MLITSACCCCSRWLGGCVLSFGSCFIPVCEILVPCWKENSWCSRSIHSCLIRWSQWWLLLIASHFHLFGIRGWREGWYVLNHYCDGTTHCAVSGVPDCCGSFVASRAPVWLSLTHGAVCWLCSFSRCGSFMLWTIVYSLSVLSYGHGFGQMGMILNSLAWWYLDRIFFWIKISLNEILFNLYFNQWNGGTNVCCFQLH